MKFVFCSELNDTVVEAEIRTREAKPPFPNEHAIQGFMESKNRLIILVCFYLNLTLGNFSSFKKYVHVSPTLHISNMHIYRSVDRIHAKHF